MTTRFAHVGDKIKQEMQRLGLRPKDIADHFGIKQPSVNDLFATGRLAKKHYPQLVALNGKPLEWWFDLDAEYSEPEEEDAFFGTDEPPQQHLASERMALYKVQELEPGEQELLNLFRALLTSEQSKVTEDLRGKAGYFKTLMGELLAKVKPRA